MLRIFLISIMVMGTFSVADSYYTNTERISYDNENNVLKLKLEIYQLKEENLKLQKIIDDLKLSTKDRQANRRQEAIQDLRRQLQNNRKVSLSF